MHILAAALHPAEIILVLVYLLVVGYLGILGFKRTRDARDYLLAGRQIHPFVMAMSYGATFISTSAIVGFGGVAGMFGMSLLWLTFLNIFVGIFIAFVFLGGRTRRLGHHLDAHSFPELLGRRFQSRFIQIFAGLVIFLFIPLYAAAVLIGGCEFIATKFGIPYNVALLVFSVLIAAYVVVGGLKGVMYTDALQGTIMFVGMLILLVATYWMLGGVGDAHQRLVEMGRNPNIFGGIGFTDWTSMPEFGWGEGKYNLWWIVVSTITLGVGIGVLAQPQLAVRFMTVRSRRELNRAVLVGGIFILVMTGVAFTVGSLSNVYFKDVEEVRGVLKSVSGKSADPAKWDWVVAKQERGLNLDANGNRLNPFVGDDEKAVPVILLHLDTSYDGTADTHLVYKGYKGAAPIMPAAEFLPPHDAADPQSLLGQEVVVRPRATAFTRAVVGTDGAWSFNTGSIIPTFITRAMPWWFGLLFLLTLLAAAMSTLSSQFHAVGTSIGRDVWEQITGRHDRSVLVTRIGIILGIVIAVIISTYARGGYIIARATAIFFGLCASAFLPGFVGGLFFKRTTRAGVIASMVTGFAITTFWLAFVKETEARALGICHALTGKYALFLDSPNWSVVDPIVIALPISIVVCVVVSLMTRPPKAEHLVGCFPAKQ
jgi:SSS family solute:Na+ symporter